MGEISVDEAPSGRDQDGPLVGLRLGLLVALTVRLGLDPVGHAAHPGDRLNLDRHARFRVVVRVGLAEDHQRVPGDRGEFAHRHACGRVVCLLAGRHGRVLEDADSLAVVIQGGVRGFPRAHG